MRGRKLGSSKYGVVSYINGKPNPEYFRRHYQANREKYHMFASKWQKASMEKKFGVKYPKEIECQLCGKVISGRQLNLDHDHMTGQFRGWLCRTCNLGFGWFEKMPDKVMAYLMLAERKVVRSQNERVAI